MEDIRTIAKVFLSIESMTHKKLQKLCYYTYSWYLTLKNEKLFSEGFEAWVHGPVNRELYASYADFGWNEIPKNDVEFILNDKENKILVEHIYRIYGHMDGNQLEALTHSEEPWLIARRGLSPWESSKNLIDDEVIRVFYRNQLESN